MLCCVLWVMRFFVVSSIISYPGMSPHNLASPLNHFDPLINIGMPDTQIYIIHLNWLDLSHLVGRNKMIKLLLIYPGKHNPKNQPPLSNKNEWFLLNSVFLTPTTIKKNWCLDFPKNQQISTTKSLKKSHPAHHHHLPPVISSWRRPSVGLTFIWCLRTTRIQEDTSIVKNEGFFLG